MAFVIVIMAILASNADAKEYRFYINGVLHTATGTAGQPIDSVSWQEKGRVVTKSRDCASAVKARSAAPVAQNHRVAASVRPPQTLPAPVHQVRSCEPRLLPPAQPVTVKYNPLSPRLDDLTLNHIVRDIDRETMEILQVETGMFIPVEKPKALRVEYLEGREISRQVVWISPESQPEIFKEMYGR